MNTKTFEFKASTVERLPFSDKQTEYFDDLIKMPNSRLCLRVGKASKTWVLHYRKAHNGKVNKITKSLGNSNTITLAQGIY